MSTRIIKSLAGSLILTGLGMMLNLMMCFMFNTKPILALSFPGGDCIEHIGFGLNMLEAFTFGTEEMGAQYHISFDPISFCVTVLIFFVIIFVLTGRRRK